MERFIKAVGDSLGRRSFFRKLGKLGMGAAAVAGVLLLPRRASADCDLVCEAGCDSDLRTCLKSQCGHGDATCKHVCQEIHHSCLSGCGC